jgi:hypothetical protein
MKFEPNFILIYVIMEKLFTRIDYIIGIFHLD